MMNITVETAGPVGAISMDADFSKHRAFKEAYDPLLRPNNTILQIIDIANLKRLFTIR